MSTYILMRDALLPDHNEHPFRPSKSHRDAGTTQYLRSFQKGLLPCPHLYADPNHQLVVATSKNSARLIPIFYSLNAESFIIKANYVFIRDAVKSKLLLIHTKAYHRTREQVKEPRDYVRQPLSQDLLTARERPFVHFIVSLSIIKKKKGGGDIFSLRSSISHTMHVVFERTVLVDCSGIFDYITCRGFSTNPAATPVLWIAWFRGKRVVRLVWLPTFVYSHAMMTPTKLLRAPSCGAYSSSIEIDPQRSRSVGLLDIYGGGVHPQAEQYSVSFDWLAESMISVQKHCAARTVVFH